MKNCGPPTALRSKPHCRRPSLTALCRPRKHGSIPSLGCLQMVMHLLADDKRALVPILIKVQQLQRRLLSEADRPIFASAWNWVDAFLQCEHGVDSELYRALRQAMMARRTVFLLDGARAAHPLCARRRHVA